MGMFEDYFNEEQRAYSKVLTDPVYETCNALVDAYNRGGRVFVAGNAGSFLTACHFVEDLVKPAKTNKGINVQAVALGSNPGLQMAIANDISWEDIFSFELETQIRSSDDLFIGISVSGNSKNVVKACEIAKRARCKTIAFVGFNGENELGKMADIVVAVDSKHFGIVEDIHMSILHNIAYFMTAKVENNAA